MLIHCVYFIFGGYHYIIISLYLFIGVEVNIVLHPISGLPIIENTVHELSIYVYIASEANSRSVVGDNGATQLWDLEYTLEKAGAVVAGPVIGNTAAQQTQDLIPESADDATIVINDGVVTFDLTASPLSCDDFDMLCVTLTEDAGIAIGFTFSDGSSEAKGCINTNSICNGKLMFRKPIRL